MIEVDRIFDVDGERLLGWAWNDDNTLVEVEYATMEARHYRTPDRITPTGTAMWDRPERVEGELEELLGYDITPANALDYWVVKIRGYDRTEWGKIRGVDNAAVSRNFRMAQKVIEGEE